MNIQKFLSATLLCALTFTTPLAIAQRSGEVTRVVVGFPPGGVADNLARLMAEQLRSVTGETVVVENKPGVGGQMAVSYLRSLPADGKTVLISNSTPFVLHPLTYENLPYDAERDLDAVAQLVTVPHAIAVGIGQPFRDMKSYVEWQREHPQNKGFGIIGLGGAMHFSAVLFAKEIGVEIEPVAYKGGAQMAADLAGSHVPIGADAAGSLTELDKARKVKVIAVVGATRLPWMDGVPTTKELGYSAFDRVNVTYSAYVKAGTSEERRRRLEAALTKSVDTGSTTDALRSMGLIAAPRPGSEVKAAQREERAFWKTVVESTGFKAQ